MARKRYITSEMSTDESVAAVAAENPTAALMWPWFITGLDDWGRMTGSALKIKLQIFPAFPYTVDDIQQAIDLYVKHGLIHRYEANGSTYLAVNPEAFYKHQPYIHKSKREDDKSSVPAPTDAPWSDISRDSAESRGESREIVPSPSPSPSPSKDIRVLTPDEYQFLEVLSTIENYPLDRAKDLEMYRRLCERYPEIDPIEAIHKWAAYKLDRPLGPKDNPRSQINTAFKKYREWGQCIRAPSEPTKPKREVFV